MIFAMIFFPIELSPRSSCRRMFSGAAEAFAPTSGKPSAPPPQTIVAVASSSAGSKPKSTVGLGSRSKVGTNPSRCCNFMTSFHLHHFMSLSTHSICISFIGPNEAIGGTMAQ